MYKIAKFSKVSFEQFKEDWIKNNPTSKTLWSDDELKVIYDNIQIPQRSTAGSAGYDIIAPADVTVKFGTSVVIPTGLRCKIEDGWFLDLNPRSGHGFKMGIRLANTRGIIDSDYFGAKNEGHIMVKIVNNDNSVNTNQKSFSTEAGKGFCQGIFEIYGITEDDTCDKQRIGGMGSTDNN